MNATVIGLALCAMLALSSACSSGGSKGQATSTTVTTALVGTTPAVAATARPTPSTGTEPLDLSRYAPLTMKDAPKGATAAPGTDSLVDITGGDLVITLAKDDRTFAEAKQSILRGDGGVRFRRAVIDAADGLMYEAGDQNGTTTYLVYLRPTRAPGYACLTRDLTEGKTTTRWYTEEQARRVVAACQTLETQ